jgi:predicted nucleotidyltransferase
MPVRSLNSSVLIWPKREQVVTALEAWAKKTKAVNPALCRVGYFGSYARGDWGVGSDLDVVILVAESELPFERRTILFDLSDLPVAVDVLVHTVAEWERLTSRREGKRWWEEVIWLSL